MDEKTKVRNSYKNDSIKPKFNKPFRPFVEDKPKRICKLCGGDIAYEGGKRGSDSKLISWKGVYHTCFRTVEFRGDEL